MTFLMEISLIMFQIALMVFAFISIPIMAMLAMLVFRLVIKLIEGIK